VVSRSDWGSQKAFWTVCREKETSALLSAIYWNKHLGKCLSPTALLSLI
jgi:hypothetical protein